jgi:hypothetical protein
MGFVVGGGGGAQGEPGPPGPAGPAASSETTAWAALTLEPTGATGALQWRTQLSGQTLQLQGAVTFAAAISTETVIAALPGAVTVPQNLMIVVAATLEGGAADNASVEVGTNGNISVVPNGTDQVAEIFLAHSIPLT